MGGDEIKQLSRQISEFWFLTGHPKYVPLPLAGTLVFARSCLPVVVLSSNLCARPCGSEIWIALGQECMVFMESARWLPSLMAQNGVARQTRCKLPTYSEAGGPLFDIFCRTVG